MKKLVQKWNTLERFAKELIISYPLLVISGWILADCSDVLNLDIFINKIIACSIAVAICLGLVHAFYSIVQTLVKIRQRMLTIK